MLRVWIRDLQTNVQVGPDLRFKALIKIKNKLLLQYANYQCEKDQSE